MRSRLWLLVLLVGCGGEAARSENSLDTGKPATRSPRDAGESATSEIEFLQYMIEHEWIIGGLLQKAQGHDLTDSAKAALKHAEEHWIENEADLVRARQLYGGGRRSPAPPPRDPADSLERFQGVGYERALLEKLTSHYREEVAAVDTVLRRLNAEPVRALAERIRQQRLQDIRSLTRGGPNDSVVPAD